MGRHALVRPDIFTSSSIVEPTELDLAPSCSILDTTSG